MITTAIQVERQVSPSRLGELGVTAWPIWSKEVSEFSWVYDTQETCYLLAGRVRVTPEQGEVVEFGQGDLVTFPAGLRCTWTVLEPVRKHYQFA
ncbi:MAG: cupin domain-containing protein [Gloeomargaritaceae cyanobacterium C42_A2020_066]|nr:cupin domain-containing protein [Gloeomargaritaceae cyanobacterium C42_A2020_066]